MLSEDHLLLSIISGHHKDLNQFPTLKSQVAVLELGQLPTLQSMEFPQLDSGLSFLSASVVCKIKMVTLNLFTIKLVV